jgi:putative addiction module component (TIGR02574 family)
MTPKTLLEEILRLPVDQRLQLVEDIWDSIAATPEAVPVPAWHKAELDQRLDHPEPGPSLSWNEVRAKLHRPDRG